MVSARDGLVALLRREDRDTSLADLKRVVGDITDAHVASALTPVPSLYSGWRQTLVASLGVAGVAAAVVSIFLVQHDRPIAFATYAFWAIGPPAWFFIEWAWIFESYGDDDRLAQFKTSTELAQKFWAGVLVMLGVIIVLTHNARPSDANSNPGPAAPTSQASPAGKG